MSYNKYEIMEAKINKNLEGDQIILKKIGLKKPSIYEILTTIATDVSDLRVRVVTLEDKVEKINVDLSVIQQKLTQNNIN